MKYGIREICDVVLKAKAKMTVGNKVFYKDEPVIYFDSLKTSTMEGAATTVYAQGGRGNSRLIAWEGERTVTFTMEDALISTLGLAILTGADVIDATGTKPVIQHITERLEVGDNGEITFSEVPYIDGSNDSIYVMLLDDNGDVVSEPYIYTADGTIKKTGYTADANKPAKGNVVLVDYYTARTSKATQIEITPDKFGGNFYLEASTLFRDTNGVDMPAEFIIPNCKVQSNFTFTMASSGDPSTFTFTMDAFPDYTRFNRTKKVLSVIQVIEDTEGENVDTRKSTDDSVVNAAAEVTATGIKAFALDDTLSIGETSAIYVTLEPANATTKVEFSTTPNSKILTVNEAGKVTAIGAGADTITVKAGEETTTVEFTVAE